MVEKRSAVLIKVKKKKCIIEFKICVVMDNGSCVVATHPPFFFFAVRKRVKIN